jgi:peptidoglycan/xylan/chitin deacetylase (PgdA/CDA1 family)
MSKLLSLCFVFLFFLNSPAFSQTREIVITIDDLPFVGTTNNKEGNLKRESDRFTKIMQALVENNVPAVGFVVAGTIEHDQWKLLEQFQSSGFVIGNHTYSHLCLNSINAQKYMDDIAHADKVLLPLISGAKYFRYPYLAEGQGVTKDQVHAFLAANQYIIAPVTVDSKDFQFNAQLLAIHWRNRGKNINSIKRRYLDYIWNQTLKAEKKNQDKPQILLIHANLLNSYCLGDIIKMYKDNGYKFVSITDALPPDLYIVRPSSIPSISPETQTRPVITKIDVKA